MPTFFSANFSLTTESETLEMNKIVAKSKLAAFIR